MEDSPVVLYIEDNADNRKLVSRLLSAYGYTVHVVPDGPAGLTFVADQVPDLVLMDISMPGMDGYTVTQKMRKMDHLRQVPIIALTANVMKGDREKSIASGCDGYIQKPINVDNLPNQIESFLHRKERP